MAALHQTCAPKLRENGTVSSLDVIRFLKSRLDLNVSHSEGIRLVRGLGGGLVSEAVIERILRDAQHHENELKSKKRAKFSILKSRRKKKKRDARNSGVVHDQEPDAAVAAPDSEAFRDDMDDEELTKSVPRESDVKDGSVVGSGFQDQPNEQGIEVATPDSEAVQDDMNELTTSVPKGSDVKDGSVVDSGVHGEPVATEDREAIQKDTEKHPKHKKEPEEFLDLVQIMAILLMPTLARAGKEWHDARMPEAPVDEPEPPT